MSIEAFLLSNLLANGALLWATARALGRFEGWRVLLCALLGTIGSLLPAVNPALWPASMALLILTPPLLLGKVVPFLYIRATLLLAGGALLSGGVSLILRRTGPAGAVCALVGASLLAALFAARNPLQGDWEVRLALTVDGRTARFPALIDTGNRLREPLSGQPVVIAEAGLLEGILPRSGWRELRFGSVNGGGRMACFKPSRVTIERGRKTTRGPDVWVAVSPAPLPGEARALAPGEFCAYIH